MRLDFKFVVSGRDADEVGAGAESFTLFSDCGEYGGFHRVNAASGITGRSDAAMDYRRYERNPFMRRSL